MTRFADPIDRATELTERERDEAVADYRRLRAARSLNESGLCVDCDEPIDPRRLAVDPMAERCVSCQQEHELRARRFR